MRRRGTRTLKEFLKKTADNRAKESAIYQEEAQKMEEMAANLKKKAEEAAEEANIIQQLMDVMPEDDEKGIISSP